MKKAILLFMLFITIFILLGCSRSLNAIKSVAVISSPAVDNSLLDYLKGLDIFNSSELENIMINKDDFIKRLGNLHSTYSDLFILVDKANGVDAAYVPGDLIEINSAVLPTTKRNMKIREEVLPQLQSMLNAASVLGIKLIITSAYRSYEYQEGLFQYYVDTLGKEKAEMISATPGNSQHQLGTAIDFFPTELEFRLTEEYNWLLKNAHLYGFSLSYPSDGYPTGYSFEPWHWRYLGVYALEFINIYFSGSQQKMLEFMSIIDNNNYDLISTQHSK